MYRIVNAQGRTVFRTDIFSRSQAGSGTIDPARDHWPGTVETLDGSVGCSVVIDADVVRPSFPSTPFGVQPELIPADTFWATEFTPGAPVPTTLTDLIIYELHVGSLGFGKPSHGDLSDAIVSNRPHRATGAHAAHIVEVLEAISTSVDEGRPVEVTSSFPRPVPDTNGAHSP